MLCLDCVNDRHDFNADGICEHPGGSCTCEYNDTDPEFNDRWAFSPFIDRDELTMAVLLAALPADQRAKNTPNERARTRALALAEEHGFPVAA